MRTENADGTVIEKNSEKTEYRWAEPKRLFKGSKWLNSRDLGFTVIFRFQGCSYFKVNWGNRTYPWRRSTGSHWNWVPIEIEPTDNWSVDIRGSHQERRILYAAPRCEWDCVSWNVVRRDKALGPTIAHGISSQKSDIICLPFIFVHADDILHHSHSKLVSKFFTGAAFEVLMYIQIQRRAALTHTKCTRVAKCGYSSYFQSSSLARICDEVNMLSLVHVIAMTRQEEMLPE